MNRVVIWAAGVSAMYIAGVASVLWSPSMDDSTDLTTQSVVSRVLWTFKHMEIANDGGLTLTEYCAHTPGRQASQDGSCIRRFSDMDGNADGRVASDEMVNFYLSRFKSADRDGDGRVTVDEWLAQQAALDEQVYARTKDD